MSAFAQRWWGHAGELVCLGNLRSGTTSGGIQWRFDTHISAPHDSIKRVRDFSDLNLVKSGYYIHLGFEYDVA